MSDSIVVHIDSPSLSSTITKFPFSVSGWILIPEDCPLSSIAKSLSLSVIYEQGIQIRNAQFSNVAIGGSCLTTDSTQWLYLSKPLKISGAGRKIAADGFSSHLCFDFTGEIDSSDELGEKEISGRLAVVAELDRWRSISELSQLTFARREKFQEPFGGLNSPSLSSWAGDFCYLEGWAVCADDKLCSVEILIGDCKVATLAHGDFIRDYRHTFPDLMEEGGSFAGVLSFKEVCKITQSKGRLINSILSAHCVFASGKTLQLEIPGFSWIPGISLSNRQRALFGGVDYVRSLDCGRLQFSGWSFDTASRPPTYFLKAGKKKIPLTLDHSFAQANLFNRPDVINDKADLSSPLQNGVQAIFDPAVFGQIPGRISLNVECGDSTIRLSNFFSEFEMARLVYRGLAPNSLKRGLLHWVRFVAHSLAPFSRGLPSERCQQRKRILLFTHNCSAVEGAPKVFLNIAKQLRTSLPEIDLHLLTMAHGALEEDFKALKIPVTVMPEIGVAGLSTENYYRGLGRVCNLLAEGQFDFVYANVIDSFVAVDAAYRLGIPASWLIHESVDPLAAYPQLSTELRSIFIRRLQSVNELLFVSDTTRELFQLRLHHSRTQVIKNGVDLKMIDQNRAEISKEKARAIIGLASDEIVITIVGTTTHRKGQDIFLKEMALLKSAHPESKFSFFVVGARDGSYLESLAEITKALGIENQVYFIKETPTVSHYFIASDAMVVASREESSPLVSLEAFAYERPLVSTTVFGLAEQIRNGENALEFRIDQPGSLATAIWNIVSDSSLRETIIREARRDAEQKFSLSASLSQHCAMVARSLDL